MSPHRRHVLALATLALLGAAAPAADPVVFVSSFAAGDEGGGALVLPGRRQAGSGRPRRPRLATEHVARVVLGHPPWRQQRRDAHRGQMYIY